MRKLLIFLIIYITLPAQELKNLQNLTKLIDLIEKKDNLQFSSILLHETVRCFQDFEANLWQLNRPQIIITAKINKSQLKLIFNNKILAIKCLKLEKNIRAQLQELAEYTTGMRWIRTLFFLNTKKENTKLLKEIFEISFELNMLNVILIQQNFGIDKSYFNYKPFPMLRVQKHILKRENFMEFFPDRLLNVYGQIIRTYPDQLKPRTLLYRDLNGDIQMIGYIGRLLSTFAKRINASLKYPDGLEIGRSVFFLDLLQLVHNGSLDIPASIVDLHQAPTIPQYTRFIEIGKWFPMFPVSNELPAYRLYGRIFNMMAWLIFLIFYIMFTGISYLMKFIFRNQKTKRPSTPFYILILNNQVLLGLTGGTYETKIPSLPNPISKCLYFFMLFIAGLELTTTINTFLYSYLTQPPLETKIESFEDMKRHNLKIMLSAAESSLLKEYTSFEFLQDYGSLLRFTSNITEYLTNRGNFNTTTAYSTASAIWFVYEQQQSYFTRKLFRRSENICFANFMIYVLPLPINSIYELALNRYIAQLQASGIFTYWYRSTFFDMLKVGAITFNDLSKVRSIEPLRFEDFYWIWIFLVLGLSLSALICITEIFWKHVEKFYKTLLKINFIKILK